MKSYDKIVTYTIATVKVLLIGTVVIFVVSAFLPIEQTGHSFVKPYTAIELAGRDIYIREGCVDCHNQSVHKEMSRYNEYVTPETTAYNSTFSLDSRYVGPNLQAVGGKYPDSWHYMHIKNPQSMFPYSKMPAYDWLGREPIVTSYSFVRARVLDNGYTVEEVQSNINEFKRLVTSARYNSRSARDKVTDPELKSSITELDALVAYVQKLGKEVMRVRQP